MTVFKVGEPMAMLVADGKVKVDGHVIGFGARDVTVSVEALAPNAACVLRREGWRARLVAIEAQLARIADGVEDEASCLDLVHQDVQALIDGDTDPTEGLVRLTAEGFAEIESWHGTCKGEGWETDEDLLDRLRREVGA